MSLLRPFAPLVACIAEAGCASALRVGLLALLACLALQALLLPAQRTAGGAHFHLATPMPDDDARVVERRGNDTIRHATRVDAHGEPGDRHDQHAGERAHHHENVAEHSHADESSDVVYVDDGDARSSESRGVGLKRGILDHEGVWSAGTRCFTAAAAPPQPAGEAARFLSQVTSPLERPPRLAA